MFECYNSIIGFTAIDCECEATDRPIDYNESKSGLFLDEMTPIAGMMGLEGCDKSMWDILQNARKGAISKFVKDTNALLAGKYRLKRKPAKNQILGQIKATDIYDPSKNYAVVNWVCSPIRGGVFKLRSLGTVFENVGTVELSIYDNVTGLLSIHTLNTNAHKLEVNVLDLELPMYSKYVQYLEYTFVYSFDSNNRPKDTEVDCGCGSWIPFYNKDNPYFMEVGHKRAQWADYVLVGGTTVDSLSEIEDLPNILKNRMYGLVFDVTFSCKIGKIFCDESMDFEGNPLALSSAFAIRYAAAALVAEAVLKSPLLNRENMVAQEDWEMSQIEWQEKYNEHTNYIVGEIDISANDCLACKDILEMGRQGLFA